MRKELELARPLIWYDSFRLTLYRLVTVTFCYFKPAHLQPVAISHAAVSFLEQEFYQSIAEYIKQYQAPRVVIVDFHSDQDQGGSSVVIFHKRRDSNIYFNFTAASTIVDLRLIRPSE